MAVASSTRCGKAGGWLVPTDSKGLDMEGEDECQGLDWPGGGNRPMRMRMQMQNTMRWVVQIERKKERKRGRGVFLVFFGFFFLVW